MRSDGYGVEITSAEVWAVIRARHPELKVFGTYSDPSGGRNPDRGMMFTSYGFPNANFPLIEAETVWEIDHEKPSNRINEKHTYWLCIPRRGEE